MKLKHYVPVSVAVFLGAVVGAAYFDVPALPFVLIILVGETILGFQLEDGRVPRFLTEVFGNKPGSGKPLPR